jgi:hypothetical protein
VVAVFLLAGTGIALLTAAMLLWPGTRLDWLWRLNPAAHAGFASLGKGAAILLVAVAVATLAASRGLWLGRPWGWWLSTGIFAVNVAGDLVRFWMGDVLEGAAGLLIGGGFLLYMLQPHVTRYFRR